MAKLLQDKTGIETGYFFYSGPDYSGINGAGAVGRLRGGGELRGELVIAASASPWLSERGNAGISSLVSNDGPSAEALRTSRTCYS
jgi:hypothetical protein